MEYFKPFLKAMTPPEADSLRPLLLDKITSDLFDEMDFGHSDVITSDELIEWTKRGNNIIDRLTDIINREFFNIWSGRQEEKQLRSLRNNHNHNKDDNNHNNQNCNNQNRNNHKRNNNTRELSSCSKNCAPSPNVACIQEPLLPLPPPPPPSSYNAPKTIQYIAPSTYGGGASSPCPPVGRMTRSGRFL
eukprot:NODE_22906_length_689_cov_2.521352.p2 GENE.NODE_22906_length_689_cov_2.521352~~NODE_22906_length_689_cov_2.521352.p2  ORF type:complete len:199 (-),score=76.73 NODE_22906_length_689_cov_2.521352:91-657(-)